MTLVADSEPPPFSLSEVRAMVLGEPASVVEELSGRFKKDLEAFLKSWHRLYSRLAVRAPPWKPKTRAMACTQFLRSAAYSLNAAGLILVRACRCHSATSCGSTERLLRWRYCVRIKAQAF